MSAAKRQEFTPYYEDAAVAIYHGDARDVLPILEHADAIVTDPPYGIGFVYDGYEDTSEAWEQLMNEIVPVMRAQADFVVMPSCAIKRMGWWYANHPPDWLISWYKGSPGHAAQIGFNDWEPHLTWGKPPKPIHDYFATSCGFEDNGHPCPKPLDWATWLVLRCCEFGGLIIDPFCGSGTTLRAAKNLGRRAIGIERNERYCEVAARRMGQEVLDLGAVA